MQFQPLEQRIVIRHRHRALLPEEAAPYIALIYGAAKELKDIDEEAVFKACDELAL